MKYLTLILIVTLLSACSSTSQVEPVTPVEIRTVQVPRPAPIVPSVDKLDLRTVNWIVITPENIDEVFNNMTGEKVLFAVTTNGYESIALNLSDIRAMIQQQQRIIAIYERQFR